MLLTGRNYFIGKQPGENFPVKFFRILVLVNYLSFIIHSFVIPL